MNAGMNAVAKQILVTVIAVPLIGLLWLLADGTRPYLHSNQPVVVDIPRGARTVAIARELEQAGAIRSRWTFLGLHLLRWGNSLKAGEYEFAQPASTLAVLSKITRGDVSYEVLTIPEGDNRFDIADLVAAEGFSTREEFLRATEDPQPIADLDPEAKDLEGYLFPDSYRLPRHARPAEIVRAMVERFRQVAAPLEWAAAGPAANRPAGADPPLREVVTIASMVEKETSLASERPLIAGVFYNRLKRDLPLQCDPTVVYAALVANRFTGRIRKEDLTFDSPYNTYVRKGLPAGPIANPGKAALLAALHPQSTDYLYFVANDEGGHTFSKTLDEHNTAAEKYRQDHLARLNALHEPSPNAATSAGAPSTSPAAGTSTVTHSAPNPAQRPSTPNSPSYPSPRPAPSSARPVLSRHNG
jgi:peptidoglycan lytic transglycosylase G